MISAEAKSLPPSKAVALLKLPHVLESWSLVRAKIDSILSNPTDELARMLSHASSSAYRLFSPALLQFICSQALEIGQHFPVADTPMPAALNYLRQGENSDIILDQRQILCILSHAMLGTLQHSEHFEGPRILCLRSFLDHSGRRPETPSKLDCMLTYFNSCKRRIEEDGPSWRGNKVMISRRTLPSAVSVEEWKSLRMELSDFTIKTDGAIEDEPDSLQADFANKFIGGGVLSHGCVQEEIRFLVSPECLVTLLLCETIQPDEAILIRGTERFSSYSGYSRTFRCEGEFEDVNPIDGEGFRANLLVAIDAINYRHFTDKNLQYSPEHILRDLNKCLSALRPWPCEALDAPKPFATGNWGCGAFEGDPQLKSFEQWLAASLGGRPVIYFPFNDPRVAELQEMIDLVLSRSDSSARKVDVGTLSEWVFDYDSLINRRGSRKGHAFPTFFDYIRNKKAKFDEETNLTELCDDEICMAKGLRHHESKCWNKHPELNPFSTKKGFPRNPTPECPSEVESTSAAFSGAEIIGGTEGSKDDKVVVDGVDYSKLMLRLKRFAEEHVERKPVFLVLGGSFCPVHRGHIDTFHEAEAILRSQGLEVVGGFLGISSDDWVRNKIGGDGFMSLEERVRLCELACEGSDLVVPVPWGMASCSKILSTIYDEVKRIPVSAGMHDNDIPLGKRFPTIEGLMICGADMIVRGVYTNQSVVAVARDGFDMSEEIDARLSRGLTTYPIALSDSTGSSELSSFSSTMCRKMVKAGEWEGLKEAKILHPSVFTYLQSQYVGVHGH